MAKGPIRIFFTHFPKRANKQTDTKHSLIQFSQQPNKTKTKKRENQKKPSIQNPQFRKEKRITSIATANHEDPRRGWEILPNKWAKRRVTLVPVKGATFLDIAGIPVQRIAIVVRIAARYVSEHYYL